MQVLKTTKAVLIRLWWKGHLCIIRAKEKRREKLNNIQLLLEIHLWADLIGKDPPLCSNCEYYDVHVECAACSEYFCEQCWDAVHYGGKRSKHPLKLFY